MPVAGDLHPMLGQLDQFRGEHVNLEAVGLGRQEQHVRRLIGAAPHIAIKIPLACLTIARVSARSVGGSSSKPGSTDSVTAGTSGRVWSRDPGMTLLLGTQA